MPFGGLPLPFHRNSRFPGSEKYPTCRASIDPLFSVTCTLYHFPNTVSTLIW